MNRPLLARNFITLLLTLSVFSPLHGETLEQIFLLASKNDSQIRAAEASLKANLETRKISRSALLPQINGNANFRDSQTVSSNPLLANDAQSTTYTASLNQVLFDLPTWYNYKSGSATANRAETDFLTAKQSLILRTTDAYLDVLRAADTLLSLRSEEKALKLQLEQAKERYEVGLIAITDVLEAQAAYHDVTARLVQVQGNIGIVFESLGVLTGQTHRSIAPLDSSFPILSPVPNTAESWVELALQNSAALTSSELARNAARYNAKSATTQHLPSLNLSFQYADNRLGGDLSAFQDDTQSETINLSLDVPIYSGGRVSAQRRQAHHQFEQAQENLETTQRNLIQDTRNAYLTTTTAIATIQARKQSVKSTESALEATQAGYEVGTRDLVEVLRSERAFHSAQLSYQLSRYDYIFNILTLKFTAGVLTSEDLMKINQSLDLSNQIPRSLLLNNEF